MAFQFTPGFGKVPIRPDPLTQDQVHDVLQIAQTVTVVVERNLSASTALAIVSEATSNHPNRTESVTSTLSITQDTTRVREITASASSSFTLTQSATNVYEHDSCCPIPLYMDVSGGNDTVYLPPAAQMEGDAYEIKKTDATGYTITVEPDGSETIDGEDRIIISDQNVTLSIRSDGSNWQIV
jgi:hypothetical protein